MPSKQSGWPSGAASGAEFIPCQEIVQIGSRRRSNSNNGRGTITSRFGRASEFFITGGTRRLPPAMPPGEQASRMGVRPDPTATADVSETSQLVTLQRSEAGKMQLFPKLRLGNTCPAKLCFAARETEFRGSAFPNGVWERG